MCRLIAYLGDTVLLETILVKPENSIIRQSLHARETDVPTNGDGFGLGWYVHDISNTPALFTSISPAWGDRNLLNLTAKIRSTCFFAHVRAASTGAVSQYNCHPFVHGKWMLMHNGGIADFIAIKRHLRRLLDDDIYNWIKGDTDSEHLFALFLQLAKGKNLSQIAVVGETLMKTIQLINQLVASYGKRKTSYFNICLTDGKRIFLTRYCTNKRIMPLTLHYFSGRSFVHSEDPSVIHDVKQCVLIASERLTELSSDWQNVPANYLVMIDERHRRTAISF